MEISLLTFYAMSTAVGAIIAAWVLYRERHPRKSKRQQGQSERGTPPGTNGPA